MKIYKVQAPDGTIIKLEGPEGASEQEVIKQAQLLYKQPEAPKAPEKTAGDYVKEFGQSAASLADTVLGAPAAIGQHIGSGVGMAFGLSPEEARQSASKVTQPFMTPVGSAFGVTDTPAYQNEASKRIMQGASDVTNQYVAKPLAEATGMDPGYVEHMVGTGMMAAGPMMGRAGQAVGRGVYAAEPAIAAIAKAPIAAAKAPFQFGKGAIRGLSEPYNESTSAMVPLREQYTPVPAAERFMGNMPNVPPQTLEQLQSQARPTSELITSPIDKFATATAPKAPTGEPLVPLQGRGMEAWGERVGRGVIQHPFQAMAELGLTAATGIPFKTIGQGVSELAARRLASKTGFSPEFPQAVQAAENVQAAQGRAGLQAGMPPTQNLLPAPGPVAPSTIPMSGPQRSVNIEGESFNLPHQIDTSNSQAARPQPIAPVAPTGTPKEISQQVAVQKLQENQPAQPQPPVQPAVPQPTPAARAPKQTTSKPVTQPLRTSDTIRNELDMIARQSDELHQQGLAEGIKYGTPEGESHQAQLGQLDARAKVLQKELEEAKKAEKKAAKKKAPNVSQMITEDTIFATKAEWEKANMFNKLAGKKPVGGYKEGENVVRHETNDYSSVPEGLRKHLEDVSIVKRNTKGKRIE